jgi:hypothetical protein
MLTTLVLDGATENENENEHGTCLLDASENENGQRSSLAVFSRPSFAHFPFFSFARARARLMLVLVLVLLLVLVPRPVLVLVLVSCSSASRTRGSFSRRARVLDTDEIDTPPFPTTTVEHNSEPALARVRTEPRQLTCVSATRAMFGLQPAGFLARVGTRTLPVATRHLPAKNGPAGRRVRAAAGTGTGRPLDTRGYTRGVT